MPHRARELLKSCCCCRKIIGALLPPTAERLHTDDDKNGTAQIFNNSLLTGRLDVDLEKRIIKSIMWTTFLMQKLDIVIN